MKFGGGKDRDIIDSENNNDINVVAVFSNVFMFQSLRQPSM